MITVSVFKYQKVLLYFLFFLGMLFVNGCMVAGGGFLIHEPPKNIKCGEPWIISLGHSVTPYDPKERFGKLTERYKDVTIHIRDSINNDFVAVPMVIESSDKARGEIQYIAHMKAIPCESGITSVEYYTDSIFDGVYNRSQYFVVPIKK